MEGSRPLASHASEMTTRSASMTSRARRMLNPLPGPTPGIFSECSAKEKCVSAAHFLNSVIFSSSASANNKNAAPFVASE